MAHGGSPDDPWKKAYAHESSSGKNQHPQGGEEGIDPGENNKKPRSFYDAGFHTLMNCA